MKKILLANPRGFCAGVDRAIAIVEKALQMFGAPIYVRHEVVHNKTVVDNLKNKGAIFTDYIEEIPECSIVVFSAHGVSQLVRNQAIERRLKVFDATCPLVTKVHMEVARCARDHRECVLIGHAWHAEVEGTMGQYDSLEGGIYLVENEAQVERLCPKNPDNMIYVTQTTLSVDDTVKIIAALKAKFPNICSPKKEDICYATQNRQDAVKQLAELSDIVLVVGSAASSNSNRLRELAEQLGVPAYMIDNADELKRGWFEGKNVIGVTAGASAPEHLVKGLVNQLLEWGAESVEELAGQHETIEFALPKEMRAV